MPDTRTFQPPDHDVPIRDAATVIVLRGAHDGDGGAEALLLRRHRRSGFAADAWVFPGGVVDVADGAVPPQCWRGIDPQALAPRFNATPERTLALHVAAVRETFEESGLLLASRRGGGPVDMADPSVQRMRRDLADREHPAGGAEFNAWLAKHEVVLELGALELWARWITPNWETRRYDTRFFLARAPHGQVAAFDDVEVTDQHWLPPREALRRAAAGELHMIRPTIKNLEELDAACGAVGSVDAAFACAARREAVRPVLPHFEVRDDGGVRVLYPGDDGYPTERYAEELSR